VKAFTLLELLVVICAIGLTAALSLPAINKSLQAGRKAKEIGAIKSLITAYNTYTADNDGILLKSYDRNGTANNISGALMEGEDMHEAHRWPWRLAPYFNYGFYNTTHINDIELYIRSKGGLSQAYLVSVIPSFGLNLLCGGNDYESSKNKLTVATRAVQVAKPSLFVAFVSSRSQAIGEKFEGFYYVEPPTVNPRYSKSSSPKSTGYISARYNDKAVVAFLGGNVQVVPYSDLVTNKTYWSVEGQ